MEGIKLSQAFRHHANGGIEEIPPQYGPAANPHFGAKTGITAEVSPETTRGLDI